MTILVFGNGYIGKRFTESFPDAVLSPVRIDDRAQVGDELRRHRPRWVLNAAGKTGSPNVDACERIPLPTAISNVAGPLLLAEACADADVHLVHLGSGCIFYGPSPSPGGWREDDFANPVSTYSRTKYALDLALARVANVAIVRLRMPIDDRPDPRNLITKLVGYKHVIDVENSVSVVQDLLPAIHALGERRGSGIFHAVNPGVMRHRDLLAAYRDIVDKNHSWSLTTPDQLLRQGAIVRERSNCILRNERLEAMGIRLRPIDEALRDCLRTYAIRSRRPA